MFSGGIRNPVRDFRIALAITLAAWASIVWGVLEMRAAGWADELGSGLKIGLAMLPALIGPFLVLNFWWAVRLVAARRRGEGVLARWRVTAETLAAFIPEDAARNRHGPEYVNDWAPPRAIPPGGIDIIFGADGVVAHRGYFPLVTTGYYTFQKVGLLPHAPRSIEFVTTTTHSSQETTRRFTAVLRLPLTDADEPAALAVVDHYRQVRAGAIDANPSFYRRRARLGLIVAGLFMPVVVGGLVLHQGGDTAYGDVAAIMMIFGAMFGGAGLFLALLATLLDRRRRS